MNGKMCFKGWLSVGVVVLISLTGYGLTLDDSGAMVDRERALAAAQEVTSDTFPNAETVLVDAMQKMRYNADGTYEQWHEEYVKILTEQGRRGYQTLSSYFTIPYQRGPEDCRISLVEIIRPDGTVEPINVEEQSQVMINPASMSANIYNPNDKIIKVNISGLETNDIVHFIMYDRIVQPRMKDTWCDWLVFESSRPIVRTEVEIDAPRDFPLQSIALKDPVDDTVTFEQADEGDRIIYRWVVKDVPRMFPEPNMPPMHTVVQRVLVSTAPDWETVSRWYWDLSEPHLETTPEMAEQVDELVEGVTNRQERIHAIFDFVSKQIRYMGITVEANAPGYEPHDVRDTFEARHGVCRDKAALLVAMLRLADLEAFPTLIHNGPRKDTEVPQPYFNHAIVAVREPDGAFLLMDPTDETTTELLPAYLNDKSFLVATPDGETLRTSPIDPAERNMMDIQTEARLSDDGHLEANTVLHFAGINDNAYRGWFARNKPEDRKRYFESLIKQAAAGARLQEVSYAPEDMTDTTTTLVVRLSYEADDVLIPAGDKTLIPMPVLGARVGIMNFVIGKTGLKERQYPLKTDVACGVRETVHLDLPESLSDVILLPKIEAVNDEALQWSMTCTFTNGALETVGDMRLKVTEFSPEQYQDLKDLLRAVETDLKKMPLVARAEVSSAPDTRLRLIDVVHNIQDASNWVMTVKIEKEILTYAGKKKNGEVKLSYNPAWERLELESGRVKDADGKWHEISAKEINIMDASWVGAAKRYPGSKTLVASFPAVDVGSIIEYRYTRTCSNRPFFAVHEAYRSYDPIVNKTVKFVLPEGLKAKTRVVQADKLTADRHEEDGAIQQTWSIDQISAIRKEPHTPPWWTFNPAVLYSLGDLSDYSRQVHGLLQEASTDQAATAERTRELLAGITDAEQKIETIRNFVSLQIRPIGPGLNRLPLSAISASDVTLADGYGNTTDRAIVLYTMLTAAGFKPEFVLASSYPDLPLFRETLVEVPDTDDYPSVLVRVPAPNATDPHAWIYLNDTDQYAVLGATPHEGMLGLLLPQGDMIQIQPTRPNRSERHYRLKLDDEGTASLAVEYQYYGTAFGDKRQGYEEMTPEERRRYFLEMVAQVSQAAEAQGDLITDFSNYPGRVEYTVTVPDYGIRDQQFLYFRLPSTLEYFFSFGLDKRVNPMYMRQARSDEMTVEIQAPADFKAVALPPAIKTGGPAGLQLSVDPYENAQGDQWTYRATIARDAAIVPPADYDALLQIDRRLSEKQAEWILLEAQ